MRKNKMAKIGALTALIVSLTGGMISPPERIMTNVKSNFSMASAAIKRKTTSVDSAKGGKTSKTAKTKKVKKAEIKKKKKIARKYVGKPLSSLVKVIGKYKRLSKTRSCYYVNEFDGMAKYDGFSVYCHTKNRKKWYIDIVE